MQIYEIYFRLSTSDHKLCELLGSLLLLYAETHYSFKGIYSRLKKDEPEIIADLPHRLKPGAALPLLLLIKDADRYPILLHSVQVELSCGAVRQNLNFNFGADIDKNLWENILEITPDKHFHGPCQADVTIHFTRNGKRRVVKNDNYAGTSHTLLKVYIAEEPLPKTSGWYFGEFHCHSSYTSDQVEFGAPLEATARLAQSMGLSFFCATDHSYDLDDEPTNYLKNDPQLTKWKALQEEIAHFNSNNPNFVIVPGEEVSAGNHKNRNVHFLILNHPEFIPGAGDSAEKWLRTQPDLSISEILNRINSGAVAFAAHPGTRPPFLEWLLVRRGKWELNDCSDPRLRGLQIWNGSENGLQEGKQLWIKLLLQGKRIFISGGNDAHGNFNRFRQIGFPFFTMREHHEHLFGQVRTGVFMENGLALDAIVEACKHGRMIVTNGPFVNMWVKNENDEIARLGDSISGNEFQIAINCLSSPEFGPLKELRIYQGDLITRQEKLLKLETRFPSSFRLYEEMTMDKEPNPIYIRAELVSEREGKRFLCLTNPIWIT